MGAPDIPSMVPIEFKGIHSQAHWNKFSTIESATAYFEVTFVTLTARVLSHQSRRPLMMKLSKLIPSKTWASRKNEATGKFDRIELHTADDVNKLALNDNIFVQGDEVDTSIGNAIQLKVEELCATLISRQTSNANITRLWVAPPKS